MAKRIIVPLDMSETAEAALPVAKGLARQLNLPVTLVTVLDVPAQFGSYVRHTVPANEPFMPRADAPVSTASPFGRWTGWSSSQPTERQLDRVASQTAEAERYLRETAEKFEGITTEITVQYGSPAGAILHTAERRDNSIIVIASHGRSGIGRTVLGSVALKVAQSSPSPVFVVRADGALADPGEFRVKRIVAPVDGSGFSESGLKQALDMFGGAETVLHLLHVVRDPIFGETADAGAYLRWLTVQTSGMVGQITTEVREGRPAIEINSVAEEQSADMIVMGTHGYSGIDRFIIGSVAERVLHDARRPLMLFRPATWYGEGLGERPSN